MSAVKRSAWHFAGCIGLCLLGFFVSGPYLFGCFAGFVSGLWFGDLWRDVASARGQK